MADRVPRSVEHPLWPVIRDMADAAVLVDARGTVRKVSPAFEALSGSTEDALIGLSLQHLHGFQSPGGKGARSKDRPFPCLEDNPLWDEIVSVPLSGEDGAPSGFIHVVKEVSARGRSADDLIAFVASQDSHGEVDLESLLDVGRRYFALDIGVFSRSGEDGDRIEATSSDLDRPIPGLDDALRHVLPLPSDDEVLATACADASAGRLRAFHRQTGFEALLACTVQGTKRPFGTLWFVGRKPRLRAFADAEKQALRFLARWLASCLEVKQAKRACEDANRRLRTSEEHYRTLYEKTPAMLHSIDDQGRLASVSDAWLATMGYRRDEVIGRPSTDFLTPESRRYAKDVVLPAYRAVGYCHDIAYQFVTKAGDIRDILLSAVSQKRSSRQRVSKPRDPDRYYRAAAHRTQSGQENRSAAAIQCRSRAFRPDRVP